MKEELLACLRERSNDLIIAVGDIHGCHMALKTLLIELYATDCPCIFLGDYIDRGPSSMAVIDQLIDARERRPQWKFLLGNHEAMLLDDRFARVAGIGENAAIDQYAEAGGIPEMHQKFLMTLSAYFESRNFIFVHGGVARNFELPMADQLVEDLIWTYDIPPTWNGKTIVRGHLTVESPVIWKKTISIDTGCCYGGWLTAAFLDDSTGAMIGYLQVSRDGEVVRYVQLCP